MSRGLVYLRPTHLVYIRRTGDYRRSAPEAWRALLGWMQANGLMRNDMTYYGLARDNPMKVAAEACRFDACIELPAALDGSPVLETVLRQRLPGGSYARHRFFGRYRDLRENTLELCRQVPAQGLRFADERPSVVIMRSHPLLAREEAGKAEICIPVSALAPKSTAAA